MNHRCSFSFAGLVAAGLSSLLPSCSSSAADVATLDAGVDAASSSAPTGPLFAADAAPLPSSRPSTSATSALPTEYDGPTAENPVGYCATAVGGGGSPVLDDFEDGDEKTVEDDGRSGTWYFYDDETGGTRAHSVTADPTAERAGLVLAISGSDFSDWGSGFGAGLQWNTAQCTYDASSYAGIQFWARGSGHPRAALQNLDVRPVDLGGTCPADATCFDSHGVNLELNDEWTLYRLSFEEFAQAGWGADVGALEPDAIYLMEFQFPAAESYAMWLDDVEFFRAEAGPAPGDAAADAAVTLDSGTTSTDDAASPPAQADAAPGRDATAMDAAAMDAAVMDAAATSDAEVRDASAGNTQ